MGIRSQIKKFSESKDEKVVAKNMIYLTILQVIIYLCPLITSPYLARVIGTDGFGKLAFAAAVMVWIQTIADWGYNYTATRDISKHREDAGYVSRVFSTVFWGRWILTAFTLVVLLLLIVFVPKFRQHTLLLFFSFIMIPGHILFPDWFFQALERMEFITIMNAVIRVLFMGAVFVFIRHPEDYVYQPLLISVGYVLCGIVSMYIIVRRWGVKIVKIPLGEVFSYIRNSTNIFINNLMPNLYNSFSYVLLNFVSTDSNTGLYNAGRKFPEMANSMLSVIGRAFFPYLNRNMSKHRQYALFSIGLSVVFCVILILLARPLTILFWGSEFAGSVIVLRITAVTIVFNTVNTVYGINYLMVIGRDRLLRNLTVIASVVGFAVSFPLVWMYDYVGVSLSFLIANILMGVLPWTAAVVIRKRNNL